MSGITWGELHEADPADKGHSAVQYGSGENKGYGYSYSRVRRYVRCECGAKLSSPVDSLASYRKHRTRELAKLEVTAE